ncbi:hypothetical protein V491_06377 [Pseudogymnoascus sp. VKM F-3775]|nr:hypothetical protein V491_06377 [Pseudogymnoascus sp. VKM F-3775]
MSGLGQNRLHDSNGSATHFADVIEEQIKLLETIFVVPASKLNVVSHFVREITKGLKVEGGSIPMNPTWCMGFPDGNEQGHYFTLDLGGTNLRVCQVTLSDKKSKFDIIQSKYRIPEELKTGESDALWEYIADSLD